MVEIKRYFIFILILSSFSFSSFSEDNCDINECKDDCCYCSDDDYRCSGYEVRKGNEDRYCFRPDNPNKLVIPKSTPSSLLEPLPFGISFERLKGSFSKKYGGCNVIYNGEKGKLKIQFTKGQVDKFKKYCDNFDFSTILDISYWLKERNQDKFTELVNHKEDDVKIEFGEEHELQEKIESIRSGVESGNHGEGDFDLKVEFIIEDNRR